MARMAPGLTIARSASPFDTASTADGASLPNRQTPQSSSPCCRNWIRACRVSQSSAATSSHATSSISRDRITAGISRGVCGNGPGAREACMESALFHDVEIQATDALDFRCDPVAVLQKDPAWTAHTGRCPGRNAVARLEREYPTQVGHLLGNVKDHVSGVAVLHHLVIHRAGNSQGMRIWHELFRRDR